MKNIIITPKHIKRELLIWLFCLVVAIAFNIYAIIIYQTSWSELYSQVGYIIALSVFFYAVLWLFRGLFRLVKYFRKR